MALILTDLDDTVLDWTNPFFSFLKTKTNIVSPTHILHQQLGESLGISEIDADELTHIFNTSDEFFNLPPYADAYDVLDYLSNNHRFVGITSGSSSKMDIKETQRRRMDNLEKHYPGIFSDLIVLPLHGDKSEALNKFYPCYWIEDNFHNALKGIHAKHEVFLIDRPNNAHYQDERVKRVKTWSEIQKYL